MVWTPNHIISSLHLHLAACHITYKLASRIAYQQTVRMLKEVRRVYPWSRVILVGPKITGNQQRCTAIRRLNALMQHIAIRERLVLLLNMTHIKDFC